MAAFSRFPVPFLHPVNGSGTPYPGALLYFYTAGTTTPLNTYSDKDLTTPNAHPVVADANGLFGQIFLGSGTYDVVLKTSAGATVWTAEDVAASAVSNATTTVAGIVELATTAEALTGTSSSLGMTPATVAASIQQGFSYGTTGGSANAITVTPSITPTALASGMTIYFRASSTNTGATTIEIPTLGVVSARVDGGSGATACSGGEIIANNVYSATYSGSDTCWLVSPVGFNPASANSATIGTSMAPGDRILMYDLSATAVRAMTLATLRPFSSKTSSYTVVDNDCGGSIKVSGLSADATITLPAASGRAGFVITIINFDTTWGVIVDGNASETIDGSTTKKTSSSCPVTLYCDGTNWHTISGKWVFRSTAQSISSAGTQTLQHGLGQTPVQSWVELRCTTTNANYAVGDRVAMPTVNADSTRAGVAVVHNATDLFYRYGSSANVFLVVDKTTGSLTASTNTSWEAYFYAST